jgi:hypothetical protein
MFAILLWMFADVCCKERVDERSIVGAMPELPEIVRSRLGQMTPGKPADHPDANLLAAFAERTLLERERATVVAHLAECADCRESLALACAAREPEVAAVAGHATASPTRHWFQAWRWVAPSAVGCCVVAVAVQYGVRPPSPEKTLATAMVSSKAAPPVRDNLDAQLGPQAADIEKLKVEKASKPVGQLLLAKKVKAVRQDGLPQAAQDEKAANYSAAAASASIKETLPSTKVGAAQENISVKRAAPPALEASALRKDSEQAVSAPAAATSDAFLAQRGANAPANAGRVAESFSMAAPAPKAAAAGGLLKTLPAMPWAMWSINASPGTLGHSAGVVERSMDRGKTWEAVPLSDRVSFRAVAVAGSHVWAGGSEGALFHSADGGSHWVQISVADEYGKLTGTIVSIDAGDISRVQITTSSGEAWISSDGGGRWKRK